jgi:hypothetical protein
MDPGQGRLIRLPLRQGALSADAVFEDMLTGWKQQQLARNFTAGTIRGRESLVRRFADHTGHFPWDWTVGDADEFFAHERSILKPGVRDHPRLPDPSEGVLRLPDRSGL